MEDDALSRADERRARRMAERVFAQVRAGDLDLLRHLDDGVPVGLSDSDGNHLVLLAAHGGHVEMVRALVDRGADVDHRNHRGQTALALAVLRKDEAMVRALLAAGADPDVGTPTARETAQMLGRDRLSTLLPTGDPPIDPTRRCGQ